MDTLYIVMPAYNEAENIRAVVEQWYPKLEDASDRSRLVVADSGSTDRTREILKEMRAGGFTKLEALDTGCQYHGPKLIALYDYAIRSGADYVFQTDSYGQTDPDEFDAFWKRRRRYAAIFGYRKERGDGQDRAFVERVVCLLVRGFFGVKVPDANAPFRLMRADRLKEYLCRLPSDYHIPNIMITTYFAYYKEKIAFRQISFKPRKKGVNSMNLSKIVRTGWIALGDFARFKKEMSER